MSRTAAFAAHAPLMGVPGAASPPGGEGDWFRGAGGLRLRAGFWTPSTLQAKTPRGTVVLSPGRTEPIEKYFELIGNFLARGFCVLAHDWRGQGLSARLLPDRLRGHARAVEEFLDDYARLLAPPEEGAAERFGRIVIRALAHLMDGNVMEPDLEATAWLMVNAAQTRIGALEREGQDAEGRIRQLLEEQDGSEVLDAQLQDEQARLRRVEERVGAMTDFREIMAEEFEALFGKAWTPRSGSRTGRSVTAAQIEARDYLRARKEAELKAKAPAGQPVIVAGGVEFEDVTAIFGALDKALGRTGDMILVHGGAGKGVDRVAALWARERKVASVVCKPDFARHQRSAPFKRNDAMLALKPRGVIIFPGAGVSENLAQKAEAAGVKVWRPVKAAEAVPSPA